MPFTLTLEHEDGSPAEPSTFSTAVPSWRPGDTIPLGTGRAGACAWSRSVAAPPALDDDAVPVVEAA